MLTDYHMKLNRAGVPVYRPREKAVGRIGNTNQKVYFYIDENDNMFVRVGCWFSDMAAFKERVKKVYAGTYEKTYLKACELAELMLKGGNEDYLQRGKTGGRGND